MQQTKKVVRVVYHFPCPDGGYAALAAYLHYHKRHDIDLKFIPHATFRPLVVEDNPLFPPEAEVFLLDYVGPQDFVHRISKQVKAVVLLDHHRTAVEYVEEWRAANNLPENFTAELDEQKSGATLAWDYFSKDKPLVKDEDVQEKLKRVYAYIEDNDLWKHSLPNSREFSVGLSSKNVEWDIDKNNSLFLQLQCFEVEKLVALGSSEVGRANEIISKELEKSFPIYLGGKDSGYGECLAVETTNSSLRSQLGHQLALKSLSVGLRGIGAICYSEKDMADKDNKWKVSLRSIEEEDTASISRFFGGGGHKNASSFSLLMATWDTWKKEQQH